MGVTRGQLPEGRVAKPGRRWDCRHGTPIISRGFTGMTDYWRNVLTAILWHGRQTDWKTLP